MSDNSKVRIKVYLHADKNTMWEQGEKLGFTGDKLRLFSHSLCELQVTLEVDTKTGLSEVIEVKE